MLGGYDGIRTPVRGAENLRRAPLHHCGEAAGRGPLPRGRGRRHDDLPLGGELAGGEDTDAIQALETTTGRSRLAGHLPRALSHASAVAFGTRIVLLGGRAHGSPLRGMLEYVPASGQLREAGALPIAVMDAAASGAGRTAYLVGGIGATGRTLDSVIAVHG